MGSYWYNDYIKKSLQISLCIENVTKTDDKASGNHFNKLFTLTADKLIRKFPQVNRACLTIIYKIQIKNPYPCIQPTQRKSKN